MKSVICDEFDGGKTDVYKISASKLGMLKSAEFKISRSLLLRKPFFSNCVFPIITLVEFYILWMIDKDQFYLFLIFSPSVINTSIDSNLICTLRLCLGVSFFGITRRGETCMFLYWHVIDISDISFKFRSINIRSSKKIHLILNYLRVVNK